MRLMKLLALAGLATCLTGGLAQAKDWKTVRIGVDATYPPFESVDSSKGKPSSAGRSNTATISVRKHEGHLHLAEPGLGRHHPGACCRASST